MTSREIKNLIEYHKTSQKELATKIGCSAVELTYTITGERKIQWIREALASALGMSVDLMFDAEFEAVAALRKAS